MFSGGGGERSCCMCNARLPMAGCTAGWCWLCYWLCAGKPSAALHDSKCVVFHSAPGEGTQLARAAAVAAAGEQVVGIAQKYAAALREAGLEAGHVIQFAHAQQLVFAGIDNDRRRAPHARSAGKIIVSQWEEPAVVRFVESGSSRVVACGCMGEEHSESLLDIFAAEAEVAACGGGGGPGFGRRHRARAGGDSPPG